MKRKCSFSCPHQLFYCNFAYDEYPEATTSHKVIPTVVIYIAEIYSHKYYGFALWRIDDESLRFLYDVFALNDQHVLLPFIVEQICQLLMYEHKIKTAVNMSHKISWLSEYFAWEL